MKYKKTIVVGISSGIAAYKVLDLIKLLKDKNMDIYVIMTQHAACMINPVVFEKASGHKVYLTLFPKRFNYKDVLDKKIIEHIKVADTASLFVIVPATANIIGKTASGIADDFLTTSLLATTAPILICPSMNTHMWNNPIMQENIRKLEKLDYYILSPESGSLACGYKGIGRLPDIKVIAKEIFRILGQKNKLKGNKIMVTAGGTIEAIDAVRVITNRSSGKMGLALAEESYIQGAEVLLLRASSSIFSRLEIKEKIFRTANELSDLIQKYISNYDVIFHCAAVSDFIPIKTFPPKYDSNKSVTLKLTPAKKILHYIKSWNPKIKLIGFKAVYKETDRDLIRIGLNKLNESQADYIIVNDVGREGVGFEVDTNEVFILSPKGLLAKIDKAPKKEVAKKILEFIVMDNS